MFMIYECFQTILYMGTDDIVKLINTALIFHPRFEMPESFCFMNILPCEINRQPVTNN